jgi:hypothetical protein
MLMDNVMLGFATFFMGDLFDIEQKTYPSLLWMYFTSSSLRGVMYAGFSAKIIADWLLMGKEFKSHKMIAAGLFGYTAYTMSRSAVETFKSKLNSWQTTATNTGKGLDGTWWVGGGDGEWFGFVGHNGADETTILPAPLLEQMSVRRDQEVDIVAMEEVNCEEDSQ